MTAIDPPSTTSGSVPVVAPAPDALPVHPRGRFVGSEGKFFGLVARGNVFMLLTLGIYRFWLNTDIRRFLWGNTDINGDTLEYTGTAKELLFGFLLALVLLLPLNAAIYIATVIPSLLSYIIAAISFVLLLLIGQFAFFRARRYRLTRTIFRGARFYQTGSAVTYSLYANLWMIPVLLSVGLLYPWAAASLERYKMRHTHFGDQSGSFSGSGINLFFRGILIWLIALAPVFFAAIASLVTLDLKAVIEAFGAADVEAALEGVGTKNPAFVASLGFLAGAVVWSMFAGALLYPLFRAINLRWWLDGLQLGPIRTTSRLRKRQVYWIYLRFLLLSMAVGAVFSAFAGMFVGLFMSLVDAPEEFASRLLESIPLQIGVGALAIAGYAILLLAYSALYQATVMLRFWRLSFEMTEFAGLHALDFIKVGQHAKSGVFGEGLADALDVGGL